MNQIAAFDTMEFVVKYDEEKEHGIYILSTVYTLELESMISHHVKWVWQRFSLLNAHRNLVSNYENYLECFKLDEMRKLVIKDLSDEEVKNEIGNIINPLIRSIGESYKILIKTIRKTKIRL